MINNTDNKNLKTSNFKINEDTEDVTKYGEFVSSYFAWTGLDKQREIVDRIQNITKNR